MSLYNSFLNAVKTLQRNRARSALTSVGIIIGISSVIMMMGIANSATEAVKERIYSFGTNAMSVTSRSPLKRLTKIDSINLKQYSEIKYASLVRIQSKMSALYLNHKVLTQLFGVENDFFNIQGWNVEYGRLFADGEIQANEKVVILGNTVRVKLFGYQDPTGKIVSIEGFPFTVIGTLYSKGKALSGDDFDNLIITPYETITKRMYGETPLNMIYIQSQNEKVYNQAVVTVRHYFRKSHNLPDAQNDDFTIETNTKYMDLAENVSKTLTYLLIAIAAISLIVGGIGIMNIMLVSVSERTREIGIRMAIGAKRNDILIHFLIEAITLCSIGGILGIAFGMGGYAGVVAYLDWHFVFSPLSMVVSFIFACSVGIFFGYYPARLASDLDPIEALRYE